jgi:uncharacterized protein YndB with AHSA1/START domain
MNESAGEVVGDEPIVITRDIDLDVSTDELWQLIADGDRWAEWLTERSDVVVEPSQSGTVIDERGVERHVAIESVVPGERVRFAWWPSDRPGESSIVELVVAPATWLDGERSHLSVIETYAAVASSAPAQAWDVRLMLLVLCVGAVTLIRA